MKDINKKNNEKYLKFSLFQFTFKKSIHSIIIEDVKEV